MYRLQSSAAMYSERKRNRQVLSINLQAIILIYYKLYMEQIEIPQSVAKSRGVRTTVSHTAC